MNGTVYCLRNDLAPTVLWYNATLMKQWGYQVPTTWAQYEQLGAEGRHAAPGLHRGRRRGHLHPGDLLWASQCQANHITGIRAVTVNVTTLRTATRMASLLDTLIKDKSMSKLSVFSSAFDKNEKGKVLMLPGPVWYRRGGVRQHLRAEHAQGPDRRRADAAVARDATPATGERRRGHLAAVGALRAPDRPSTSSTG